MLTWSACQKPPQYSDVPNITFNSFSTDTVTQFSGVVTFIVDFTDGDADLGVPSSDTSINMYIIDTRGNDTLYYRIPEIPTEGSAFGIAGEIEVDISQLCCINPGIPTLCTPNPGVYDEAVFKILIRDNADNWSNTITTDTLIIQCFE